LFPLLVAHYAAGVAFFCQRDAPDLDLGFFSGCIRYPVFFPKDAGQQLRGD